MNEFTTLKEAQAYVQSNLEEGVPCPCCEQFCKIYRRKLNSTMARLLIALVRSYSKERRWYSVREPWHLRICQGGDLGKLSYWGFVVEKAKSTLDLAQKPGSKTSGFWRPSEAGRQFVMKRTTASSHVLIYNGTKLAFDGQQVSINECLSDHFDYEELMGCRP